MSHNVLGFPTPLNPKAQPKTLARRHLGFGKPGVRTWAKGCGRAHFMTYLLANIMN